MRVISLIFLALLAPRAEAFFSLPASLSPPLVEEGTPLEVSLAPEGSSPSDPLSFYCVSHSKDGGASRSGCPTGASLDEASRALKWRPGFDQEGGWSVNLRMRDRAARKDSISTLTVTVTAGNRPPTSGVVSCSSRAVTADETGAIPAVTCAVSRFSDPDGDAPVLVLNEGACSSLSLDAATGVVSGSVSGACSFSVGVHDGAEGAVARGVAGIAVSTLSRALLAGAASASVQEGSQVDVPLSLRRVSGRTRTPVSGASWACVSAKKNGQNFSCESSILSFVTEDGQTALRLSPGGSDSGEYEVQVRASLGAASADATAKISVRDMNPPPTAHVSSPRAGASVKSPFVVAGVCDTPGSTVALTLGGTASASSTCDQKKRFSATVAAATNGEATLGVAASMGGVTGPTSIRKFNVTEAGQAASCSFGGETIAHGASAQRTRYQAASVPTGSSCAEQQQTATCDNGVIGSFSGGYAFESCSVEGPALNFVAARGNSSCAVVAGVFKCWGDNTNGKLGDGSSGDLGTPTTVLGISSPLDVAIGGSASCAVLGGGGVKCWGSNSYGQLGNNLYYSSLNPVDVFGITNAVKVSASPIHACAVLSDGTINCWGLNGWGQLGNGSTTASNLPVAVSGISSAVEVSISESFSCAVVADGVKCWGSNNSGELGNGSTTASNVPVAVAGISSAVDVSTGGSHACAALSTGAVKCWGSNYTGQLGDDSTISSTNPVGVSGVTNAVKVAAGSYHSCALLSGGGVKCWGYNNQGQLGDGTKTDRPSPVEVSNISDAIDIAVGDSHSCAFLDGGEVKCWGYNSDGQLGSFKYTTVAAATSVDATVLSVAAGSHHSCAVLSDGTVQCWGYNYYGQLGDGTTTDKTIPVSVSGITDADKVAVGTQHSCALLSGGGIKCWGSNNMGRLGDGSMTPSYVPVDVSGISSAVDIALGDAHSCAIVSGGTVKCWGYNTYGQLGDGTQTLQMSPIDVEGVTNAVKIIAGYFHTCAMLSGGGVKCWGGDWAGQLGQGVASGISTIPVDASTLTGAIKIAAAESHYCAVFQTGTVKCWGYNWYGQLGNGSTTESWSPVTVSGITGAIDVDVGALHSCAVLAGGGVKCWGYNAGGGLGDGTLVNKMTPVDVLGISIDANSVALGKDNSSAILEDGSLVSWGLNDWGQSASLTAVPFATTPQLVGGL